MTKNLLNTALILGTLFIAGCGGGSTNTTDETIENKILGVWEPLYSPCKNDEFYGESKKTVAHFISDTIVKADKKTYSEFGCNEDDLIYHEVITIRYKIGDLVQASNGDEAYEFDMTKISEEVIVGEPNGDEEENLEQTRYSMIAMLDIDQYEDVLVFAKGDDLEHDGSSPEKRENILDDSMIRIQ